MRKLRDEAPSEAKLSTNTRRDGQSDITNDGELEMARVLNVNGRVRWKESFCRNSVSEVAPSFVRMYQGGTLMLMSPCDYQTGTASVEMMSRW